jgi:predicted nucleic acid-binding protein
LAAVEIDEESLPERCAIDSAVLFLALDHKPHRSGTPAARAMWKALVESDRVNRGARVYIPALVVAELARGAAPARAPRVAGVHIAPFGARAAHALGRHFSHAFIDAQQKATGQRLHYLKYDALIAATAVALGATLVTLDEWLLGLTGLPIRICKPDHFFRRQLPIEFPDPAGSTTSAVPKTQK